MQELAEIEPGGWWRVTWMEADMSFERCNVVQIMPAQPDWRAIFADETEEGLVIETQLAGWLLVERPDGSRGVVGFDATGETESCEALENFLGYAAPGETASRWHRDATAYFRAKATSRAGIGPATIASAPPVLDVIHAQGRALELRDWQALALLYRADATYADPDVRLTGREAIVDRARALETPFTDVAYDITDEFATPARVAIEWRYRGTNHGPMTLPNGVEVPPTGRTVDVCGASLFAIENGLIVAETSRWDNAALFGQLGLLTDPDLVGSW